MVARIACRGTMAQAYSSTSSISKIPWTTKDSSRNTTKRRTDKFQTCQQTQEQPILRMRMELYMRELPRRLYNANPQFQMERIMSISVPIMRCWSEIRPVWEEIWSLGRKLHPSSRRYSRSSTCRCNRAKWGQICTRSRWQQEDQLMLTRLVPQSLTLSTRKLSARKVKARAWGPALLLPEELLEQRWGIHRWRGTSRTAVLIFKHILHQSRDRDSLALEWSTMSNRARIKGRVDQGQIRDTALKLPRTQCPNSQKRVKVTTVKIWWRTKEQTRITSWLQRSAKHKEWESKAQTK